MMGRQTDDQGHLFYDFRLGHEPINLPGGRLARVRYAPIAIKFRSAAKCRDGAIGRHSLEVIIGS